MPTYTLTNSSTVKLVLRAIADTLPLCIAVIPWGILTGALAIQVDMSPAQAQLMSLLVFAGAAQLSGMTLIASSASLGAIFASTFVISSRHLLYSVVFREHIAKLSKPTKLMMAFVLTDEMFAVSQAHTQRAGYFSEIFALVSGFTFYIIWNIATLLGILLGDSFKELDSFGLDFAIVAMFIAMTFGELRRLPVLVTVLVSGFSAVALKPIFSDSYIVIAALLGMAAAFILGEESDK